MDRGLLIGLIAAIIFAATIQLCDFLHRRRNRAQAVDLWEEMSLVGDEPIATT